MSSQSSLAHSNSPVSSTIMSDAGQPTAPGTRTTVLATGFGASVAMWAIGYVTHLRQGLVPGGIILVLLILALMGAGAIAKSRTGRMWSAAWCGVVASVINLFALGSLLANSSGGLGRDAAWWIPASIVLGAVCSSIGGLIAGALGRSDRPHWTAAQARHVFCIVATCAVGLVIVAGGLVTSTETGLAVPDWPNTYGANMFLYPLSRMTGGIYYEHAHRLYGALVGLCILATAIILWFGDRRRWIRLLGAVAFVMVCGQGVLGGLRVTGRLTTSQEAADLAPNLKLAMVHGVFAHVLLGVMVILVAATNRGWSQAADDVSAGTDSGVRRDRGFAWVLVAALMVQLIFGALLRHLSTADALLPWPGHVHITGALIAFALVVLVGIRCMAAGGTLRRVGIALHALGTVQVLLGIAALFAVLHAAGDTGLTDVLLTSMHQANGAGLLGAAVFAAAWTTKRATDLNPVSNA